MGQCTRCWERMAGCRITSWTQTRTQAHGSIFLGEQILFLSCFRRRKLNWGHSDLHGADMSGEHMYGMPPPFNSMAPAYPQVTTQMPSQVPPPAPALLTSPYAQPFDNSLPANHMPPSGNVDSLSPAFSTGYSPAMLALNNPNATTDSSPYSFWSGSITQSSPSNSGMPSYHQSLHQGPPNIVNAPTHASSTSPYSFGNPSLPRQSSDSPAMAGLNIMRTKGNSPLTPAPAGMASLGAIPTTYSSIMPAPLIPTGTPLADHPEKNKKRACEACNHSKVKCDFQIPCGKSELSVTSWSTLNLCAF